MLVKLRKGIDYPQRDKSEAEIILEKTDDWHALTMPQIQEELLKYGVTADRKSLYDDMEALRILGIDVIGEKEGRGIFCKPVGTYMG